MSGSKARSEFSKATPVAFEKSQGNSKVLEKLGRIEDRANRIGERVIAHAKRFEDRWVAKEGWRLWEKQAEMLRKHPGPAEAAPGVSKNQIERMAHRNVAARTNQRLSRVNAMKTRMQNAVVRNDPALAQTQRADQSQSPVLQNKKRIKP